jgi:nicotinamidase-related amidase
MNRSTKRTHPIAVLLIDVINTFAFPEAGPLVREAHRIAPRIASLAARARRAGAPVIYVNDHFGDWRSDFNRTIAEATAEHSAGRGVALQLLPEKNDYFVLKPRHSGFYSSSLPPLLGDLNVGTVVLAGFATNYCVLFTANDAYMRDLQVIVPSDCTASNTKALTRAALAHVRVALKGKTPAGSAVRFDRSRRS